MLIYKITNKLNGKVYIGQTIKTLDHRKKGHIQATKDGVNHHLYNAMNKYGIENFVFEEICKASTKSELNYLEAKYILEYDSVRNGYNMGYGGDNNVMDSPIVKAKHDKIMRSDDVRLKISQSMKQYRKENPFSENHRKKISEKLKGNKHFAGHHITDEHKKALNKTHYKKVYCIDCANNIVAKFDNVQSASRWWFNNGYNTVKNELSLCDRIKYSNKKNIYIKGLKWIYE